MKIFENVIVTLFYFTILAGTNKSHISRMIVEKLNSGMKFGLFGRKFNCYFQDGTKVRYSELWAAIKEIQSLNNENKKTLAELYPDTFVGVHKYYYLWHNWRKKPQQKMAFN